LGKVFVDLLSPTQLALDSVTSIRERNRGSKLFNHLATVGEGISTLGWVTMEGAEAAKYVGEMRDASQFYGNRVVREYKDRYILRSPRAQKLIIVERRFTKNGRLRSLISLMNSRNTSGSISHKELSGILKDYRLNHSLELVL
jgi:hypothetical protein